MAADGLADCAILQGRLRDAETMLEEAITKDVAANDKTAAARKLALLANVRLFRGQGTAALAAADLALGTARDHVVMFSAARTFLEAGRQDKARALISELRAGFGLEDRIQAALLMGELHLRRHDIHYAMDAFNDAQKIGDTWMGHYDLGRANLEARQFTAADSEFENCLHRRGEAVAVFLDDIPTYRYLPMVYYYLGRAQEGIQSPGAMESYQKFTSLKAGDEDPLLADVRRRLEIH